MRISRIILTLSLSLACLAFDTKVQGQSTELLPNRPITISLNPDESKTFFLQMERDAFAEINWLARDDLTLEFGFVDSNGKALDFGNSTEHDSAVFIAPEAGKYGFLIKISKESSVTGPQSVSLEYKNKFSLPPKSKQKDLRKVNGYDVRIYCAPGTDTDFGDSIVLFEKAGKLKKILQSGGNCTYIGFSFPDNDANAKTVKAKKALNLMRMTPDKTGDGIPDVMIDYFSGGAHCCFSTYFVNLGATPEVVERIDTENAGLAPISVNPKGGLRFQTHDNSFAYWNIFFAGSPMPVVMMEFVNGELRPNFLLTKKPPPSLSVLKSKARAARLKMNNDPYTEVSMGFEEAFWDKMLDLIYTGNEDLAWQYFDLVWPSSKPGKDRFLADFREQLAQSYYGTQNINANNSFRNYMRLIEQEFRKDQ